MASCTHSDSYQHKIGQSFATQLFLRFPQFHFIWCNRWPIWAVGRSNHGNLYEPPLFQHKLVAEHETINCSTCTQQENPFVRHFRLPHSFNGACYYVNLDGVERTADRVEKLSNSVVFSSRIRRLNRIWGYSAQRSHDPLHMQPQRQSCSPHIKLIYIFPGVCHPDIYTQKNMLQSRSNGFNDTHRHF